MDAAVPLPPPHSLVHIHHGMGEDWLAPGKDMHVEARSHGLTRAFRDQLVPNSTPPPVLHAVGAVGDEGAVGRPGKQGDGLDCRRPETCCAQGVPTKPLETPAI